MNNNHSNAIPDDILLKIKTSKKIKETVNLIQCLPQDISRHIYEEYFICKPLCSRLIELLLLYNTEHNTKHLIFGELEQIMNVLIKHDCAVEHLRHQIPLFDDAYIESYLRINHLDYEYGLTCEDKNMELLTYILDKKNR